MPSEWFKAVSEVRRRAKKRTVMPSDSASRRTTSSGTFDTPRVPV
jgi:hypothetical protein